MDFVSAPTERGRAAAQLLPPILPIQEKVSSLDRGLDPVRILLTRSDGNRAEIQVVSVESMIGLLVVGIGSRPPPGRQSGQLFEFVLYIRLVSGELWNNQSIFPNHLNHIILFQESV